MKVEPQIVGSEIRCSRCTTLMHPELLYHDDQDGWARLLWRCQNGHITQPLPVPETLMSTTKARR